MTEKPESMDRHRHFNVELSLATEGRFIAAHAEVHVVVASSVNEGEASTL
jgi:hypothetical protein